MAKVGFLYTIGLLLMSLTVLTLALYIAETERKSNERVAELTKYDRLYNLDSSINEGFSEIFRVSSGINLIYNNKTNHTLFIRENLPNSNSTIFIRNMTSFEKYLNKTSNLPTDNVTLYWQNLWTVKSKLPLIIMPYNITYEHIPSFGSNTIRVTPERYNFYGYNITINEPAEVQGSLILTRAVAGSNMIVKIKVRDPTDSPVNINLRVGYQGINYVMIKSTGGSNLVNISINNSRLFIDNMAGKIDVTTGIIMRKNLTEITQVYYPRKLYNVSIFLSNATPDFNLRKVSNVKLNTFLA